MTAGRIGFGLVVLLSLAMLFAPGSDVPSGLPLNDKVVHAALFAALAVTGRLAGIRVLPLAVGLVLYAGCSELLQSVLPIGRDGDWHDAAADLLGAAAGLALAAWGLAQRR